MRSEFGFIDHIKKAYGLGRIGDDCAVLPRDAKTDLVITADMLVEGVDFKLEWGSPEHLGKKALAVSLSDVAAMGGLPAWALVSIAVPENLWRNGFADEFFAGYASAADKYGVEIVGGDVSRSPDRFVVDSVVVGEVPKGRAVMRSDAKAGDKLFVTGPLGGASAGLRLLESGIRPNVDQADKLRLIERQLLPEPRISDGQRIAALPASAMIDISDGLSSDLGHICNSSGVGARIFADRVPVDPDLAALEEPEIYAFELALNGGEDFELLFTISPSSIPAKLPDNWRQIGEITGSAGSIELVRNGDVVSLEPKAFRHF